MNTEETYDSTEDEDTVSGTFTKTEMVEHVAAEFNLEKNIARHLVDSIFEEIMFALANGNTVKVPGLGNFMVRSKKARPGRNMKTGQVVTIGERRVVSFRSSGLLNQRTSSNLVDEAEPSKA